MKSLSMFAALFFALIVPAVAAPTAVAMIESWTVGPLHLGMASDEAIEAAQQQGWLPGTVLVGRIPCESERELLIKQHQITAGHSAGTLQGSCAYWVHSDRAYLKPHVEMWFTEDYPAHPGQAVLTTIIFSAPVSTDAERASFLQHATTKYGKPDPQLSYSFGTFSRRNEAIPGDKDAVAYVSAACASASPAPTECHGINPTPDVFTDGPRMTYLLARISGSLGTVVVYDGTKVAAVRKALLATENGLMGKGTSF